MHKLSNTVLHHMPKLTSQTTMKISPETGKKALLYPALATVATLGAAIALSSCQQQREPVIFGGVPIQK